MKSLISLVVYLVSLNTSAFFVDESWYNTPCDDAAQVASKCDHYDDGTPSVEQIQECKAQIMWEEGFDSYFYTFAGTEIVCYAPEED